MTAQELYDKVKVDQLYFLATGGGVTFGGGEPLLYPSFLKQFRESCGDAWHLCTETSLNVPWENVELAAQCIDIFYIDCKDTNPDIYQRYTGKSNRQMLSNLQRLVSLIGPERIVVRIPLIPDFNTDTDRHASRQKLEHMGITQFNFFNYIIKHQPSQSK
jgi:pyruvate formate lyase activating enzyme